VGDAVSRSEQARRPSWQVVDKANLPGTHGGFIEEHQVGDRPNRYPATVH
jgi:hypothetical protein